MTEDNFDNDSARLDKALTELKRFLPRIFLNYGPDMQQAGEKILADLQRRKLDVKTIDNSIGMPNFLGKDSRAVESIFEKSIDFVLDMAAPSKSEGLHHKLRRVAQSLQLEMPENKKYQINLATDSQSAARLNQKDDDKFFAWDTDSARLQLVLEMLKRFEGQKPKISHWVEDFGNRADLLEKPYALVPLSACVGPTHKEILGEYSYLVLVDNRLTEKVGDTYHLASEVFNLAAHDGKITVTCSGCNSEREAIKIPNTSEGRPNGMIVVASHNCEYCGNVFSVDFDSNATLQKLLDRRDGSST